MTLEGQYIRVAYNNEGYAVSGTSLANSTVGEDWMLLEVGTDGPGQRPGLQADA